MSRYITVTIDPDERLTVAGVWVGVNPVEIGMASPDFVFEVANDSEVGGGYFSTDGGETWTAPPLSSQQEAQQDLDALSSIIEGYANSAPTIVTGTHINTLAKMIIALRDSR